jgi:hypothetical protein
MRVVILNISIYIYIKNTVDEDIMLNKNVSLMYIHVLLFKRLVVFNEQWNFVP